MEIPEGLGFQVLDSLESSIAVLDTDGTILATNEAWKSFARENDLRSPVDSVGENYLAVCDAAESDHSEAAAAGIRSVLEDDQERFSLEYPCHSPDTRRWFQLTTTLTEYDGDSYGVVTHWNITDRKESELEVEQSNERLEQFAYAVSHDLQEPLRMITSYLELVEQRYADELDEDGREFIEFAVDGAERMREMIDGLLDYSRIETRGEPFQTVDLEAVVDDVRTDLQFRIEEREATVDVGDLPRVSGDANQLRQLFQNLLDNAVEYGGDEPRIEVSARSEGNRWLLSVSDDGIGMDPDDTDRVFEVFQRLHSRDEHEGTGIGLALCERIVERHDGDIRVDSEPGEGTTFSFTLPAAAEGSN